jgi:hypothetical protein
MSVKYSGNLSVILLTVLVYITSNLGIISGWAVVVSAIASVEYGGDSSASERGKAANLTSFIVHISIKPVWEKLDTALRVASHRLTSFPVAGMVYIENWDEFASASESLFVSAPSRVSVTSLRCID